MRYFLHLAYHGGPFKGWQAQRAGNTVQACLEKALETLLRRKVDLTGCGRTDTGVHAEQFYAHLDMEPVSNESGFVRSLNGLTPEEVRIYRLIQVAPDAHARFDALSRTYRYQVMQQPSPFNRDLWARLPFSSKMGRKELDRMNHAARALLGSRDYAAFAKSGSQVKTTFCTVSQAEWNLSREGLVFRIKADRFLRNMVRAVVGTLWEVGLGKLDLDGFTEVLNSGDRRKAGASVPANGLFLEQVEYPYI